MKYTTAAEALALSKSGLITDGGLTYRFNDIIKLWEYDQKFRNKGWTPSLCDPTKFLLDIFLPFETLKIDDELEAARKRYPKGSWFKDSVGADVVYTVSDVIRRNPDARIYVCYIGYEVPLEICTPIWVSNERCCVDDPPKESGDYLVRGVRKYKIETSEYQQVASFENGKWGYAAHHGDVWYSLPNRGE